MNRNSTLLFILDGCEGENELFNLNDILDPCGKCNIELENIFKCIELSPRNETIKKILLNV